MEWNPEDLVEYEPVEENNYEFVVVGANEAVSKNANPMIEMELQFEVGRKEPITVFDRLVNTPKALWMLKQFCQAVSPSINFEAGELIAANCIGLIGTAHLILGDENPKGRRYMEVAYYVVPKDNTGDLPDTKTETTEPEKPVEASVEEKSSQSQKEAEDPF